MRNIVIVGVGGQGALLASKILGSVAVLLNLDVKVSEVHGMAQRGGSVITHVRFGEKVHAPLVTLGEADTIIAFEPLEALRALPYAAPNARIITGVREIKPMTVLTGAAKYPTDIMDKLKAKASVTAFDAQTLAESLNAPRSANIALIGAMAASDDIPRDIWIRAIESSVPAKTVEANVSVFNAAFDRGR